MYLKTCPALRPSHFGGVGGAWGVSVVIQEGSQEGSCALFRTETLLWCYCCTNLKEKEIN